MEKVPPISDKPVSRRRFLGSAAAVTATGVGLLAGATVANDAPARKTRRNAHTDYDVIIVGGGFSGITAARDCQKNGLRTVVFEAKSRLGGRTFDTQFRGHHIELGGTWVHWAQPSVWAEVARYGLEVEETPGASPERMVAIVDGKPTAYATQERIEEIVTGLGTFFAESSLVWARPYDSKFQWTEIQSRDAMTAADRLKALTLTPLQRATLVPMVEAMGHCPMDQISYTEMLRWWSSGLNNFATVNDTMARFKLKEGTGALARHIAADGKAEVRLSTPVKRIEKRGEVYVVSPRNGESASARAVILALPPRVLTSIDIIPGLSSVKQTAAREGFTTSGMKYYVEVKGRQGRVEMLSSAQYRAGLLWTYAELANSTLMVGFAPHPKAFDSNDEESVQTVLRQFQPDLEVLGSVSYGWGSDPFALGTYSSFAPSGVTRFHTELARPEGAIFMAGGDIGDHTWRGFIDGAIARGTRVAREVSESLVS